MCMRRWHARAACLAVAATAMAPRAFGGDKLVLAIAKAFPDGGGYDGKWGGHGVPPAGHPERVRPTADDEGSLLGGVPTGGRPGL